MKCCRHAFVNFIEKVVRAYLTIPCLCNITLLAPNSNVRFPPNRNVVFTGVNTVSGQLGHAGRAFSRERHHGWNRDHYDGDALIEPPKVTQAVLNGGL